LDLQINSVRPLASDVFEQNGETTVTSASGEKQSSGFRMLPEDLRALTPLIYSHVTPYGTFRLDMNQRLAIEQDAVAA
jgi:hypothetical protein